ncbi:MAG TPA: hypothetical protein DGG95_17000 [Cytophagales bacterium]|jgi:hypothetical protein|nr:hypothetical protein [Cytophagales bacterium]
MELDKSFFKDTLGWGFLLWLLGYVLGIVFFMIMPAHMIGWVITPIATIITLWVLIKKIESTSFQYYLIIGVTWLILAAVLDYFFIVKAFHPQDGYYKPDVFLYYSLTFCLPLAVAFWKQRKL